MTLVRGEKSVFRLSRYAMQNRLFDYADAEAFLRHGIDVSRVAWWPGRRWVELGSVYGGTAPKPKERYWTDLNCKPPVCGPTTREKVWLPSEEDRLATDWFQPTWAFYSHWEEVPHDHR